MLADTPPRAPKLPYSLALFLAWSLALLWPLVLHPSYVLMPPESQFSDLLISHWPNAEFLRRALFEYRQIPLWNPSLLGGAPFAADPLAGLWYPPNWIAVILPLPFAFNLLLVLHVAWAGWGMYRWARADGFGFWPSFIGGLVFAGMPKLIAHIGAGHVSLVYAVAWTPWLMMNVECGMMNAKRRASFPILHSAFIIALIFLADARWAVYAGALMIVLWLARDHSPRSFLSLFLSLSLFLLLSSILWLPMLELVRRSSRINLTPAEAGLYSLPPNYLIGLIIPNLGGFHEWMTYLGIVPLVLAIIGVFSGLRVRSDDFSRPAAEAATTNHFRDRVGKLTFLILGILAIWWALGSNAGLFTLVAQVAELTLLRVPSRAWFLVGLAVSWLAVRGAAVVENGVRPSGRVWNLASVGATAALWILALGASWITRKPAINMLGAAAIVSAVLIVLRLAGDEQRTRDDSGQSSVVSRPPSVVRRQSSLMLLTAIAVCELLWVNSTLVEARPAARSAVAEWLSQQPGLWRVYSPSYSLPQLDAAQHGIQQADGVNPIQLADTVAFMERATGVTSPGYSVTTPPFDGDVATANADALPDAALLGELNVRYVVSEFDLPVAGLTLRTRIGSTRIYENMLDLGRVRGGMLVSWSPNRIEIAADGPTQVIVSEIWYPGWVAWVDGEPVEVEKDGLFRAVTVSAGHHEVVFEFRPTTLYWGVGLGLAGFMIAAYLLVGEVGCRHPVGVSTKYETNKRMARMNHISKKEWLWVGVFAALVMALTSVPYLIGAARSDDNWRFSGFVFGVEDGNSYLAKMQLGAHGQWLFQLSYAVEDHPKAVAFVPHILLGKLAGWLAGTSDPLRLHSALVIAYHAARVILGFLLLLVSYRFLAELLPRVRQRRLGLILVALGGGLGWLLIALRAPDLPLEFYSPEAFTFLDLYGLPHLSLARICFLGGLLFYLKAVREHWAWVFAAGTAWLLMTFVMPLYMLIVFAILGMHVAILTVLSLRQRDGETTRGVDLGAAAVRALWVGALAGAAGFPMVFYTFLLFAVDPIYQVWSAQNIILAPPPWHYLSAWGLLAFAGVLGLRPLYRRSIVAWALIVGWLLALPALLYLPHNLQRRLAEGAQLPLVALAILGLTAGLIRIGRWRVGRAARRYAPVVLIAFSLPTTALVWVGGIAVAAQPAAPVYQSQDQVATYAFLARSLPPRAVVLSSYEFGNALPAYGYLVAFMGHGPETPYLDSKRDTVKEFYDPLTDSTARFEMYSYLDSPYVVISPYERKIGRFDPGNPRQANYLVQIFHSGEFAVWSLKTTR